MFILQIVLVSLFRYLVVVGARGGGGGGGGGGDSEYHSLCLDIAVCLIYHFITLALCIET